ncbi:bifunctional metallophosphatase/5'-nucleotidase [Bacteroides sp. 214]|uniref:bifunctional metallophosphatase/5'-nucleotidase n=1 Tax=Bacteroides sp. 214 TaxID=2302935 RepID=UPI0013D35677|nr:bifunctional metallophosphatase/5'-nucleotidase [Bacteroides sp. 214]NDW11569.1 bifunctional metallophosphatase/5'-nucleotidase [Bacteroides sp. 214]
MKKTLCILLLLLGVHPILAQEKEISLKLVETSDIHGRLYPYNFLEKKEASGSLARVYSYVEEKRKIYKDNLILIDNGDIIQGDPTVYYYNFIDTTSTHLCAAIMNYMKYDVANIGNHDIEPSKKVMDRWISNCSFPVLGANILNKETGKPTYKPYIIIEREGVKIAVLGLITPAVPVWLPSNLWQDLDFEDMEKSAKKWMRIIKKEENPDIVIGLFHAGQFDTILGGYKDNASLSVARRVPGFDVILMGHDHTIECKKIVSDMGDTIMVVNPGNNGTALAEVDIKLNMRYGKVEQKTITGAIISADQYHPSEAFLHQFNQAKKGVEAFLDEEIGTFQETLSTRDAYFGSSAFIDFIHMLQLQITGAEISFTSPLAYDTHIKKGSITVADMFKLYKYENLLYTIRLSGKEIKKYLEFSYDMWTNRMKSPKDHLLNLKDPEKNKNNYALKYFSYNFDSAAGLIYTVDVTKRKGKKINIISMADGSPFDENKEYTVVVNSHRGNGGGELLTKGAGIPQEKLKERIITSTNKDIRYYLIQHLRKVKELNPQPFNQWKFIPEDWAAKAAERDYHILFPQE